VLNYKCKVLLFSFSPNLTWRDVQYLIVYTSNSAAFLNSKNNWGTNGAGLHFSNSFGFGSVDAGRMVAAALKWKTVPPQKSCENFKYPENTGLVSILLCLESLFTRCKLIQSSTL